MGKVHRSGNKFYDTYCWYMRYVLDLEGPEADRLGERKASQRDMEDR